jgi:hypothetical protein
MIQFMEMTDTISSRRSDVVDKQCKAAKPIHRNQNSRGQTLLHSAA